MKTMKIMRRLMGCAAAILALSACSESEDLLSAFHSDPNAVRITAQVGKASADGFTRSNPLGTAEEQAKFNENDEISVQADGQDAVTYQFNGSEWVPQGGKFLKWEKETMNFTAYYPATFNGTITQPTEYTSIESLAAADFMSFKGPQSNTKDNNNQLSLTMERKMARVVVEIAGFNDQYAGATIDNVNSLSICGVKAYKHNDKKFYALIKPCEAQNSATFLSLDVAEGESKTTTEKLTGIPALTAGKSYTYKLTVGKNKVSVKGITVANWNTGTITDNGKAEHIIPYLTFKADAEQTFKMITEGDYTISGLEYSVNGGDWKTVVAGGDGITFGGTNGDLRLRGTNPKGTATDYNNYSNITFTKNVNVACTGDIRTLLNWKYYDTVDTQNARFNMLFYNCGVLTSAPDLPATKLADICYLSMFQGCTNLYTAPELPATKLAEYCYNSMFLGCTSLTSAPELKATELAVSCYNSMFQNCTNLNTAPKLPAKTLAEGCYSYMFLGCTHLYTAPELPATKLAKYCYERMFESCIYLNTAPELPATELAEDCYSYMFCDCRSLQKAPSLSAETLASGCYKYMFKECTNLSSATMLAPSNQILKKCIRDWLNEAGTKEGITRTLIVKDEAAYNALVDYLPDDWKKDAAGTTVQYGIKNE